MKYGCIGEHLKHSFSKEIHHALADYPYEIREVSSDALDDFLTQRDFVGINVTIPYKTRVIPHLAGISDVAREIGAVNTIVNRDGLLYGYNTDFYGLQALIERIGVSLHGAKVAILGTGGTSKTACAVARHLGAREILVVSRSPRENEITYEALEGEHTDVEYLINTTPCGMYPNGDSMAIDPAVFPLLKGAADAVYNPLNTRFILSARARGIPAEGGLYMLVAQAVRASEIFLNTKYSSNVIERVYRSIWNSKQNVVLVGMPGSGKSTVGAILAKEMGRELFDSDECIVRREGMTIPEIFASHGELSFRNAETAVLREELRYRNGCVIATGGGAILREENVEALRQNGKIYFLDRAVEELLPTDDRPLADTGEAILKRYEERYERYCAVADCRIAVKGDALCVAETIRKDFENE